MSNTLESTQYTLDDILVYFLSCSNFVRNSSRIIGERVAETQYAVGQSIEYRLANLLISVGAGSGISNNEIIDRVKTVTIDNQRNIAFDYTGKELTFSVGKRDSSAEIDAQYYSMNEYGEYTGPVKVENGLYTSAGETLSQVVEDDIASEFYKELYLVSPIVGSHINDKKVVYDTETLMDNLGIPKMNRFLALSPNDASGLLSSVEGGVKWGPAEDYYNYGSIGYLQGSSLSMFKSPSLLRHVSGTAGTDSTSNGTKSAGTVTAVTANADKLSGTITVTGARASQTGSPYYAFKKGDVIEIDPGDSGPIGYTRQFAPGAGYNIYPKATFVVTANTSTDGSGNATIPVKGSPISDSSNSAPPLRLTRSVTSASVADKVRLYQTHNVSIAYATPAIVLAIPKLRGFSGELGTLKYLVNNRNQVNLRIQMRGEVQTDTLIQRLDIGWGASYNNEYAVRILSNIVPNDSV